MSRHRPLALLLAFALALAAVGCSDDDADDSASGAPADGPAKLTVVLDWTPNTNHAGVYLAEANGWYDEAGLDVSIIEPGAAGALQLLGTGRADVAFSAQEEILPARAEGVPVVAIGAVVEHNTSSLLSLASAGIERPRDLEGHTYGGFGGPLERALVEQLVECDGGDPSTVTFAEVGDVDYRVGLEQGRYDFVWIFDGWDKIRLEQDDVEVATIPFAEHLDCIPDWYTPMMAATEDGVAERSDDLAEFMRITARGYRTAMARPDDAADALLEAVPEMDEDLVRASSEYLSTRYAEDPDAWAAQDGAVWERFAAFLAEAGMLEDGSPEAVEGAWTNQFLPER